MKPSCLLLSVKGAERERSGEAFLVQEFARFLAGQVTYPIEVGTADAGDLPRHHAGYHAVRAVIFDAVPLQSLDEFQRQALQEYLLGGGTLVLPAPNEDFAATSLAPHMPVQLIGRREAHQIVLTASAPPLKFRDAVVISEAVEAGGDVLLSDGMYIHAAVRRVGMGRIVFTSFPMNALDPSDARTPSLWEALLDLRATGDSSGVSELSGDRDRLLEAMIGAPAAPWSHAAGVAGGYLLLLVLAQLALRGVRRPTAFVVTATLGVVTCFALLVVTMLRHDDGGTIAAARLAMVDLGGHGGGVRHESWALLRGNDAPVPLTTDLRSVLRPAMTRTEDPPILNQLPFATPDAGVHSARLERVWQASAVVAADRAMLATAQFTPQGVRIEIENETGQELAAPLLAWNDRYYRLSPVSPGKSSSLLGPKNPPGDFTNVGVITGEEATLRGRIVKAAQSRRLDGAPALVGWIDPASTGLAEPIVHFSTQPQPVRAQVLLRAPVQVRRSPPGAAIAIPSDFVTLIGGPDAGVFYDPDRREWLRSLQTGAWTLGFRTPTGIGRFKPLRAKIFADLSAPGHTIVLRRGQCRGGAFVEDPVGPIAAQWESVIGAGTVSVDLASDDVDASGCLWLRLSVDVTDFGAGKIPEWKVNDLAVSLDVQMEDEAESQR